MHYLTHTEAKTWNKTNKTPEKQKTDKSGKKTLFGNQVSKLLKG